MTNKKYFIKLPAPNRLQVMNSVRPVHRRQKKKVTALGIIGFVLYFALVLGLMWVFVK
jgi:hypothetical protein